MLRARSLRASVSMFPVVCQNGTVIPFNYRCSQGCFKTLNNGFRDINGCNRFFSLASRQFICLKTPSRTAKYVSSHVALPFLAQVGKASYVGTEGLQERRKYHGRAQRQKEALQSIDKIGEGLCRMGEIHVIVGPMFAGKTTALIRRVQSEIQMGRTAVLVKSIKDTRYGVDAVVSHDGAKLPCWSATDLASFKATLGEEIYKKVDVIGIDEAQFFKDLYSFCQIAADRDGKTLIVAGLDGDYLRKSFGSALDLIPLADSVIKLNSRCQICGKAACFTLRKTGDRKTEVVGGADIYMPVCRRHYLNGQLVIDATRTVMEANRTEHETQLRAEAITSA
eukprot:TRINITY_DN7613_c0_g1_i1.p1 TRINITY_DN7613_c0_g1~~TRINITY_DN7613_c0_g1_i1.p1  ORF type:complete len:337 (-),score=54.74 TRINITY_DN7613_c0_g1_i1:299-1309(-)